MQNVSIATISRSGFRSLARSPLVVTVAIASLGLALGLTTTMFAVLDALQHPSAAIRDPQSLYELRFSSTGRIQSTMLVDLYALIHQRGTLNGRVAGEQSLSTAILQTPVDQQAVAAARVTPNYFEVLGVSAKLGRTFSGVDAPSDERVALITEGMWSFLFGPTINLKTARITINDTSYIVVGVLPSSWRQLGFPNVVLKASYKEFSSSADGFVRMFARLKPDVPAQGVRAELDVIVGGVETTTGNRPIRSEVVRFSSNSAGVAGFQLLLWIAALLILVIACSNTAILLLARGRQKQGEMALRSALGAKRQDLVALVLVESGLLAAAATAFGWLLSIWFVRLATYAIPTSLKAALGTPHLNGRVFLFSVGAALVTMVLAGLAPALRATQIDAVEALKDSAATSSVRVTKQLRGFVVAELALSFVLLVGVGFVARSILRSAAIDYGVDFRGLYRTKLNPWNASRILMVAQRSRPDSVRQASYDVEQQMNIQIRQAVQRANGVNDVGTLLSAVSVPRQTVVVDGGSRIASLERYDIVSTGFFRTLGLTDLEGRPLRLDSFVGRRVAVVDEILSRRLWGSTNPTGHLIRLGGIESDEPNLPVAAIVRPFLLDVPAGNVQSHPGQLFVVDDTIAPQGSDLLVRAMRDDRSNRESILNAMREVAPRATFSPVGLIESDHQLLLGRQQFVAKLAGAIAALGVSLSLIGLYGVVSFSSALRSREFAVRAALGASPTAVRMLVLGDGMLLVAIGGSLGVALTLLMQRAIASAFYGRGAAGIDASTITVTIATLTLVSLFACWIPSRNASSAKLNSLLRAS